MESYKQLVDRQHKEFNEQAQIKFAFNEKQFAEIMQEWDLDPETDLDKIYSMGAGGYIQRKDHAEFWALMDRHRKEKSDRIKADTTGDGFIYEMFLYELANHEFIVSGDTWETLDALNLTMEQVKENPALYHGLKKAAVKIGGESIAFLAGLS